MFSQFRMRVLSRNFIILLLLVTLLGVCTGMVFNRAYAYTKVHLTGVAKCDGTYDFTLTGDDEHETTVLSGPFAGPLGVNQVVTLNVATNELSFNVQRNGGGNIIVPASYVVTEAPTGCEPPPPPPDCDTPGNPLDCEPPPVTDPCDTKWTEDCKPPPPPVIHGEPSCNKPSQADECNEVSKDPPHTEVVVNCEGTWSVAYQGDHQEWTQISTKTNGKKCLEEEGL
jgi:hypothetical protein